VGEFDNSGDIQACAVPEADLGHRNELRFLINQLLEILERDIPVGAAGNVDYARATQFLCVPDLRMGGELEVADNDFVAPLVEIERAGERVDPGGCRSSHCDLIRLCVQHPRHQGADSLVLHHPHVPVCSYEQTVFHVVVDRLFDAVGQRAIRAAIQVGFALQDWKPAAQRLEVRDH
jgi:hypothetical protein